MDMELNIGDRIDYKDFPDIFGDELSFEELFEEPSSSLLLIWRGAFLGAEITDVRQAVVGRVERIVDEEDGPEYASIMLDVGERSPLDMEIEDMTQPDDIKDGEEKRTWNMYDRVWRVREPGAQIVEAAPVEIGAAPVQEADEVDKAQALHRRIVNDAQVAAESLWDLCTAIKEMRDGKHYKALGYANFEGYCGDGLGMSRAQAYRYISIAEGMSKENVALMRQIGTTKLALLASITEEQREEVAASVDVESVTVRELRAQVDALRQENVRMLGSIEDAKERAQRWYDTAEERRETIDELGGKVENGKREIERLNAELKNNADYIGKLQAKNESKDADIGQLRDRITELESRPVEVAVREDDAALEQLRAEHQASEAELLRKIDGLKADLAKASETKQSAYTAIMAEIQFLNNCVRSTCTQIAAVQNEDDRKTLIQYLRGIAAVIESAAEGGKKC